MAEAPTPPVESSESSYGTEARCLIEISGQKITYDILSVRLDQYVDDHHVLQVRIRKVGLSSNEGEFENPTEFSDKLGQSLSLKIEATQFSTSGSAKMKFIGIVTEVRFDSSIDGINTVLITAHSPTLAMDGAPRNRIVGQNMNLKDIVGKVVGEYEITQGRVDAGDICVENDRGNKELDSNVQLAESDMAYLRRIASENHLFAYYDGTAFNVEKAKTNNEQALSWRVDLGSFSLGVGTGQLKYKGQTWDTIKKESLTGNVGKSDLRGASSTFSGKALSASEEIYPTTGSSGAPKHAVQKQLDIALVREVEARAGRMMTCRGKSIVPSIQVGSTIRVGEMGDLSGQYWLTSVCHVFEQGGQYHNDFTCVPLEMAYPQIRYERQPYAYFQTGVVTNNEDPENLGRVKVRLAHHSSAEESEFMRIMTFDGGKERGWFALPEIDDEVLVAYERGNPNAPVVLGGLYNGKDVPPMTNSDTVAGGKVEKKIYRTRNGNEIIFVDKDGAETITITQKSGTNTLLLNMDGPRIVVESTGDILMKGKTITLETTQGDITLTSKGKIVGEAQSDVQLKATANFKSEGGMNYEAKGGIGFKATGTQANLEGSAMTTIKGGIVKIN